MPKIENMSEIQIQAQIAKCRLAYVNNDVCKCADGIARTGDSLGNYLQRLYDALPPGADRSGLTSPMDGVKPLKYPKNTPNKARVAGIKDKDLIK